MVAGGTGRHGDGHAARHHAAAPPARRASGRGLLRKLLVPLGIGLGAACGVGYGLVATPEYTATSYVIVVPQDTADSGTAVGFAQAYGRVVGGAAVLAGAQASSHLAVADLRAKVSAQSSPDAPMIAVTGTDSRAGRAARIANAVAKSLADTGNREAAATGVRLLVFSPAAAPSAPSSPSPALSGAVGAAAGGLLAGLVLLVRPRDPRGSQEPYGPPAAPVPGQAQEPAEAAV
ncbi:lipopolysaccharide biosynthesis protein [Streptomyces sp. KK5PA1]|uniref:Lipopolysaccharide biosynthesis protein n=2 Tax=Actinacidiphila acididurans TaxID=2784346 RepID=A0ABS2TR28_9ACTN|nr:lipopolysaccharide biosynthesis protein [Actinacidiphila acididurans]